MGRRGGFRRDDPRHNRPGIAAAKRSPNIPDHGSERRCSPSLSDDPDEPRSSEDLPVPSLLRSRKYGPDPRVLPDIYTNFPVHQWPENNISERDRLFRPHGEFLSRREEPRDRDLLCFPRMQSLVPVISLPGKPDMHHKTACCRFPVRALPQKL